MGTTLYITLKGGKKMDGHGCTEGRFYFGLGEVLELSTFGVRCWQVGALLEKVFWGKSARGAPARWLCPVQDVSSQCHRLHDGGPALGRVATHGEPAAAVLQCRDVSSSESPPKRESGYSFMIVLLPGPCWYGCVDVASESLCYPS